jgi:hypothetical protein
MTIDNSRTIISLRIRLFAQTVLVISWLIIVYFARLIDFPLLGLDERRWTFIILTIYFILAFYPMFLNYQYIFFSDDNDKIIIRYFTAGIVGGRKNSVEISKESFAGYKVEKRLFGLDRSIILFQQMREGVAKYPPVHISILSKKERARIINSLHRHAPPDATEVS